MPAPLDPAFDDLVRRLRRDLLGALVDLTTPEGAPPAEVLADVVSGEHVSTQVRALAVARAFDEYEKDIAEPPGKNWQRIDHYIRSAEGLGWPSAALAGSGDSRDYKRNGQFQWCGAFASFCWGALKPEIRRKHLASCYRLDQFSRGTPRRLTPSQLLPGDLAIVGTGSPSHGSHITVVVGRIAAEKGGAVVPTIEGNAKGRGPNGDTREGVISRTRPFDAPSPKSYRIMFGVRFLDIDLGV
jgi:hypothetical protein